MPAKTRGIEIMPAQSPGYNVSSYCYCKPQIHPSGHLYQTWNISIVSRLSYQDVEEMVSVLLKPAMLLNGRLQFESHLWTFLKDIRTTTLGVFFFVALFYRSSSLSLSFTSFLVTLRNKPKRRQSHRKTNTTTTNSICDCVDQNWHLKAKRCFFFS